jgi:hypothetical protein
MSSLLSWFSSTTPTEVKTDSRESLTSNVVIDSPTSQADLDELIKLIKDLPKKLHLSVDDYLYELRPYSLLYKGSYIPSEILNNLSFYSSLTLTDKVVGELPEGNAYSIYKRVVANLHRSYIRLYNSKNEVVIVKGKTIPSNRFQIMAHKYYLSGIIDDEIKKFFDEDLKEVKEEALEDFLNEVFEFYNAKAKINKIYDLHNFLKHLKDTRFEGDKISVECTLYGYDTESQKITVPSNSDFVVDNITLPALDNKWSIKRNVIREYETVFSRPIELVKYVREYKENPEIVSLCN